MVLFGAVLTDDGGPVVLGQRGDPVGRVVAVGDGAAGRSGRQRRVLRVHKPYPQAS